MFDIIHAYMYLAVRFYALLLLLLLIINWYNMCMNAYMRERREERGRERKEREKREKREAIDR